jgi:hypothetical protein
MGFIDKQDLAKIVGQLPKGDYRDYLQMVCDEDGTAGPKSVG